MCQYSSQGSVREDYIVQELGASFTGAAPPSTPFQRHVPPPEVQLVWPRVADVQNSLNGWESGAWLAVEMSPWLAHAL